MKKYFAIILALIMVLSLAACGGGSDSPQTAQSGEAQNAPASNSAAAPAADPAEGSSDSSAAESSVPAGQSASGGVTPASDGTLTLGRADIAVAVNGTSVPMPYNLKALEAAGVPEDESRNDIELAAGDFFTLNLYLDENEDYILMPSYYNGGDSAISIAEAEAEEISMSTYADEPVDQGVSILGVSFGMALSEVKKMLGTPSYDNGSYLEWHIEVPDMAYEGTLSMYLTGDSEDSGVSQVDLTVFPK